MTRLGYSRIGICLQKQSEYFIGATISDFYFNAPVTERIQTLYHAFKEETREEELVAWLKRYKPEVIVGYDNHLKQWAEKAGYRIPEDVGIVHLALDDDVLDWAGIHSQRREMGGTAIEWLVSLMRNRRFGVPKTPLSILIQGTWRTGITLGSSKGRKRASKKRG